MTTGWKLDREQRAALLKRHKPRYDKIIADHVTLAISGDEPPPPAQSAEIVGYVDDGLGIEAMIVAINGSTCRPDGKTWHITWSLAEGRTARESNDVIFEFGWEQEESVQLILIPELW